MGGTVDSTGGSTGGSSGDSNVDVGSGVAGASSAVAVDSTGAARTIAQPNSRAATAARLRTCRGRADARKTAKRADSDTTNPLGLVQGYVAVKSTSHAPKK